MATKSKRKIQAPPLPGTRAPGWVPGTPIRPPVHTAKLPAPADWPRVLWRLLKAELKRQETTWEVWSAPWHLNPQPSAEAAWALLRATARVIAPAPFVKDTEEAWGLCITRAHELYDTQAPQEAAA